MPETNGGICPLPRRFRRCSNTDCPGATSANVRTLGHTVANRPLYPLEGPERRASSSQEGHARTLGADFAWEPVVELYPMGPRVA